MNEKLRGNLIVRIARAIFFPFYTSYENGHFLSCLLRKAVNKNGNPIPCYTYPVLDLLYQRKNALAHRSVLEFGGGQSTLWWASVAKEIVTSEQNPEWASYIKRSLEKSHKRDCVKIIVGEKPGECQKQLVNEQFDIIVIDGEPRIEAAEVAPYLLKKDGIIIFDNADLQRLKRINDFFHKQGFNQHPYVGNNPGSFYKQCTVIYSKQSWFWDSKYPILPLSPLSHYN